MAGRLMPLFVGAAAGAVAVSVWHTFGMAGDRSNAEHVDVPIDAANGVGVAEEFASGPDIDAALANLPEIRDPIGRRAAALELAEVLDYDQAGIDRIAAALSSLDAVHFRIDAIVQSAERDPAGAMEAAMALPERSQQQLTLERMAPVLARRDPVGALTRAEMIDVSEVRRVFASELLNAWAAFDPGAVLQHVLTADGFTPPSAPIAYEAIGTSDPEGVLAVINRLPDTVRYAAMHGALSVLVQQDAAAALAHIDALPPGVRRDALLPDLVTDFAASDPDGALAFADSGLSAHTWLRSWVLAGIQRTDPDRALELVLSELSSPASARRGAMQNGINVYLNSVVRHGTSEVIANTFDRLIELDASGIENALSNQLADGLGWARSDPGSAFEWALRHADRLEPTTFERVGRALATANRDIAQQALYRLPEQVRAPWVTGLVRFGADFDPDGTRAWTLSLPAGALRDTALREFLRLQSLGGSVDTSLFAGISDPGERDAAAVRVAVNLAAEGDLARACQVAGAHIVSEAAKRDASRRIEPCRLD